MMKKIRSLFTVTILLISLIITGCGSNEKNNSNDTEISTYVATTVITKEESATAEEKDDGTIKITTEIRGEIEITSENT